MIYGECVKVPGDIIGDVRETLVLVHIDTGVETIADSQSYGCVGLGASGFLGLFWSPNSRYFYFNTAREGGPEGNCTDWEPSFLRLDTTSLDKMDLGAGPISPDRRKIATWQGQELVVWDINQGELGRVPAIVPDATTGSIAWSPDSQALVYLQYTSLCPSAGEKSYVVHVNLTNFEQVLLLKSDKPTFASVKWETSRELKLLGGYRYGETRKEWSYNLDTRELSAAP